MVNAALKYGAKGYRVFPTHTAKNGLCSCGKADCENAGKHPRIKAWQTEASTSEVQIREWWRKWPSANIGLKVPERFAVLDVDPRNGGAESLEELLMEHGRLPDGPTAETGGGGLHCWFRLRYGMRPPQKDTVAGYHRPGLEWRTDVHYVIAPPSLHRSGNVYEWQVDSELGECDIPEAPAWLVAGSRSPGQGSTGESDSIASHSRGGAGCQEAGKIREGQRNNYLASRAGTMRRQGFGAAVIEAALRAENEAVCEPPLPESEVKGIAASISKYEPGPNRDQAGAEEPPGKPNGSLACCLDSIEQFVRRFIVLPSNAESVAVTLWIAHTHMADQAETSPYLGITSAEKQCGKSRLLDVLELLAARPWKATLPTEAVIYRKISQDRPTLLLDELDAVFGPAAKSDYEGLRALLNAGNRRGTRVPRVQGKGRGFELVEFDTFCPKALAGIGRLPGTVADRAIPIRLQRRTKAEKIERLRAKDGARLAKPIRTELEAHAAIVELPCDVEIPDELGDRAADGWETLLCIAEAAGGHWPKRARAAAKALSGGDEDDESWGVRLLAALRTLFKEKEGVWSSAELVAKLNEDDESPWKEYGKAGLTAPSLARLLKPYEIRSGNHRMGSAVRKGYAACQFEDVFSRFLPDQPASRYSATGAGVEPGSEGKGVAA